MTLRSGSYWTRENVFESVVCGERCYHRHETEEEARQCWRERYGQPTRPLTPADLAGSVVRRCTAPGIDGYPVTFWTTLLEEPEE